MSATNGNPALSGVADFLKPSSISGSSDRDIRLLKRAVKEKWPMSAEMRKLAIERLALVISRETATIPHGDGTLESEAVADRNAVAAVAVLHTIQRDNHDRALDLAKFRQAERFQKEGSRVYQTSDVRMIVADARGNERAGTFADVERAAMGTAETPSLPSPSEPQPGAEPGGDGGATGRENAP